MAVQTAASDVPPAGEETWLAPCVTTSCCATCAAGDVLLHTVTDAILGALSLPDIGKCA
jgi:2C-methyl-D-erythritol 2,4-cyclodiphosphate synthase